MNRFTLPAAVFVAAAFGAAVAAGPSPSTSVRTHAPEVPVAFASAARSLETTCTIGFASPGEECGDHGVCPDRVHRSLFWGLIEYETDIVICFCLTECDVDVPFV